VHSNLKRAIDSVVHYDCESLRALALMAEEIKISKDDEARDYFESRVNRKVAVWSRLSERFPTWFDRDDEDFTEATPDGIIALAQLCQLPTDMCARLYEAHADHINEAGALDLIRADVREHKPTRERVPKPCARCTAVHEVLDSWATILLTHDVKPLGECYDELRAALDAARKARRRKARRRSDEP
jgi:hypothetical protein